MFRPHLQKKTEVSDAVTNIKILSLSPLLTYDPKATAEGKEDK